MGTVTQKPWGIVSREWIGTNSYVDVIQICEGGYSSVHKHSKKINLFFVQAGELKVRTFHPPGVSSPKVLKLAGEQTLRPGDWCVVQQNEVHQFVATTDVWATEYYGSTHGEPCEPDDIIRYSDNGLRGDFRT